MVVSFCGQRGGPPGVGFDSLPGGGGGGTRRRNGGLEGRGFPSGRVEYRDSADRVGKNCLLAMQVETFVTRPIVGQWAVTAASPRSRGRIVVGGWKAGAGILEASRLGPPRHHTVAVNLIAG